MFFFHALLICNSFDERLGKGKRKRCLQKKEKGCRQREAANFISNFSGKKTMPGIILQNISRTAYKRSRQNCRYILFLIYKDDNGIR